MTTPEAPDFTVRDEFSIFLLTPVSADAREWVEANLGDEITTWGDSVVVEHRYIQAIIDGLTSEGYSWAPEGRSLRVAS